MSRTALAFMSYVNLDDQHEQGRLTQFRELLSGEVRMQTGESFDIFQDRKDIAWGQQWQERINDSLDAVTFLIPIITPGFFKSAACREELERFLRREEKLGRGDLILPVYYVRCPVLEENAKREHDRLAQVIAARQYADWRELRFEDFTSSLLRKSLAEMAEQIVAALERRQEEASFSVTVQPASTQKNTRTSPSKKEAANHLNTIGSSEQSIVQGKEAIGRQRGNYYVSQELENTPQSKPAAEKTEPEIRFNPININDVPNGLKLDVQGDQLEIVLCFEREGTSEFSLLWGSLWSVISVVVIAREKYFFGILSIFVAILSILPGIMKSVVRIKPGGLHIFSRTPLGETRGSYINADAIKNVRLVSNDVVLETDTGKIILWNFDNKGAREWLKNCILSVVDGQQRGNKE